MYEIVKQYAGALLVGAAALMILTILFLAWPVVDETGSTRKGSVMESLGQEVDKSLEKRVIDWGSHADGAAFDVFAERDKPSAKTKQHAVERVPIALTDLFLLMDNDGRQWRSSDKKWVSGSDIKSGVVDILSVINSKGQEIAGTVWNRDTQVFTFPEPDTVMVKIRVMDYDNAEATYTIPVAVDMEYPTP